ncbi:MAG: SAM-dependent methyltransferase [Chloroflexota bacterium]
MLQELDQLRIAISATRDPGVKSALGQFMTPVSTARFMASLFPAMQGTECHLLDPGAGIGALSAAFLERCTAGYLAFDRVTVDAWEVDADLLPYLRQTLGQYARVSRATIRVHAADFIEAAARSAARDLFAERLDPFTHAIINPPYRKIHSDSRHRLLLREIGIETVNLYSAFVALALLHLVPGGQLVAITPRSFCNGPYYRPYRELLLRHAAIRHIHLFGARDRAFSDDRVLQENTILLLERDGVQGDVIVSTSTDDSLDDYEERAEPFSRIVLPGDPERFVHVPATSTAVYDEPLPAVQHTLQDLGVEVSTGPVVDFRLQEYLRDSPQPGCVPMLYPAHIRERQVIWPRLDARKSNAIVRNPETERWLYPNGFYAVVRRFSSKEERRRIVASLVDPASFSGYHMLGFENHLNVFHWQRRGLQEVLARGLTLFLNTAAVDASFRRFSGHTQVNATDLRAIKYPSREALEALGAWGKANPRATEETIEARVEAMLP